MVDNNQLEIVLPNLVDNQTNTGPLLLGGCCEDCQRYHYPMAELCQHCGGKASQVSLGRVGRIYSHTTVRVKPPLGLPQPYRVAYIDLQDVPLRVFGLLNPAEDSFSIGDTVMLCLDRLGQNNQGEDCLRPFFSHCSNVVQNHCQNE